MDGRFKKGSTPWNKGLKTGIAPANKNQVSLTCTNCGNNFSVSQYRKYTAKFCSHSCKASFNMKGEKHPQWKGGKPSCVDCGKELSNYSNKKCSEHKGMTKENNPRWIKDRSQIKLGCRNLHDPLTKQWRKEVKNRDNWSCRIADNNCDGKLEVHHILRWSEFPELRYQPNNGITLCHYHHPRKMADEKRLVPTFMELVSVSSETLSQP